MYIYVYSVYIFKLRDADIFIRSPKSGPQPSPQASRLPRSTVKPPQARPAAQRPPQPIGQARQAKPRPLSPRPLAQPASTDR